MNASYFHAPLVCFSSLSTSFESMQCKYVYIYMLIYAVSSRWMVAARSVSLYVVISFDFYDNILWLWNWKPSWYSDGL